MLKPTIDYSDFQKIDIRIGTVKEAVVPEGSKSVIKLTVDFGEEGEKTIFSGIKAWYAPEDLIGKQFPFVVNLPEKKIGELGVSQGMILAVMDEMEPGTEKAVLMRLYENVKSGVAVR